MTRGKLHVQSCNLVWILSTVYIVCTAQPKPTGVKRTSHAMFNLVIQRPRVAGKIVTIPLDATVKLATGSRKDAEHHIVRLNYGLNGKKLAMRASSSQERDQWLFAITTALSTSQQSVKYPPSSTIESSPTSSGNMKMAKYAKKPHPNRSKEPSQVRNAVPNVSNSVSATKTQYDVSFVSPPPYVMTSSDSSSPVSNQHTANPQVPRTTHSAPANCSLRQMVRQNIPAAMQFIITVGQIVASAS